MTTNSHDSILDIDKDEDPDRQLSFQEIPHSAFPEPVSETPKGQEHSFTLFPPSAADDSEEDDKADLLKGEKKQASFWTFEYYQQFFNVETDQVLWRILGSMTPNPKSNYLYKKIRPNPDLYGPFWVCTTLVFTTAIAGNMANYFASQGANHWKYDFRKVSFAATVIFSYWWVMPIIIWGILLWRKSPTSYSFLEIICVYGYSLAVYIPISILWVIQINWLQWMLVLIGMTLSGSVLVLTFWPAVKEDDKKIAFIMLGLIVALHGLLAVGFKLYFFYVPDGGASHELYNTTTSTTTTTTTLASITTKLPVKTS